METDYNRPRRPIHLGRNTRRIREIIGMKQEVLAEKLGISQQGMSKIEQSEYIKDDTLEKVSEAFGVSIDFIKSFDEEKAIYNIQSNIRYDKGAINSSQNSYSVINNNPDISEFLDNTVKVLNELMAQIKMLQGQQGLKKSATSKTKTKKK